MDTTTSAVATGILVTVGRWSQGEGLSLNVAIGVTAYAVILSVLESANQKFAQQVALLILVSAGLIYIAPIARVLQRGNAAEAIKRQAENG